MERCLLTFFIGALLSLFLPIVPDFSYVIVITCLFFILMLFKKAHVYAALLLGAFWMLYHGAIYNHKAKTLQEQHLYQAPVILTGSIESLITEIKPSQTRKNFTQRFNFRVYKVNDNVLAEPIMVRLSWQKPSLYVDKHSIAYLKQNQQWQLPVKLKPAHGLSNTGGFHYQQWLRQHSIVATGYVKNRELSNIALLDNAVSVRQQWFDRINKAINYSVLKDNNSNVATFLALTFGVRDQLSKYNWQLLQVTGTQHVIAISGLHIGLIAATSYFIFLLFIRFLPLTLLPYSIQLKIQTLNIYYLAISFSVCCALFYSYLAGFSSPTLRAFIMLLIFWLAKVFVVRLSKVRLLLLTLCAIIIVQPMSMIGIGFWLSCYAVVIIFFIHWLYLYQLAKFSKIKRYIYSLIAVQLGLSLFILPVAALLNNELPLIAIVANLLVVPLVSFVILPCVLLTFLVNLWCDFPSLFVLTNQLLSFYWYLLAWFSGAKTTVLALSFTHITLVLVSVIFVLLSLLKATNKRLYIMLSFLPLLCIFVISHLDTFLGKEDSVKAAFLKQSFTDNQSLLNSIDKVSQWQLHVFDVGQGLAILIETKGRAILYDTGASFASGFTLSEVVVLPYLKSKGIRQLDAVIISHSDNDHAGGLPFLKDNIVIKKLIANDVMLNSDVACKHGEKFQWQGLTFHMLWPEDSHLGKDNDDSCVIRVSDGENSVLLTGDISKKVEKKLIHLFTSHEKNALDADILIAPHHGSNTSSTTEFIQAINPKYTVFSAGFLNRWNMPTEKVVKRYNDLNVKHFNTAKSGMVSFTFTPTSTIKVSEYNVHQYPFWFAR